jgi:hypothetical protein
MHCLQKPVIKMHSYLMTAFFSYLSNFIRQWMKFFILLSQNPVLVELIVLGICEVNVLIWLQFYQAFSQHGILSSAFFA